MGAVQKYLNPITLEAKLFAQSLEILSETYDALDVHLVEALENVMTSIEKFIDKNTNNEIVDTSKTKLAQCNGLKHIQRIYHCSHCKKDLGKAITKVALHVAEDCCGSQVPVIRREMPGKQMSRAEKAATRAERKEKKKDVKEQRKVQYINAAVKFNKKTTAFLSMDCTNVYQFLSDFMKVGEKLKCVPDYNIIENDIMEIIKPEFPQQSVKIYKFGSRVSGMGTRESDLDIYIDVGDKFRQFEHRPTKETVDHLHKLRRAMKLHQATWKGMVLVESARVPILKIIHSETGIECDINMSNSLGYINSQLLELIFALQPIALWMCIYVKKWLTRTNQKHDFSTYSMNLMVIFYLQQKKILPPISKFFENVDMESALTVGPWLSSFVSLTLNDLGIQMAKMNDFMQHIRGFFEFYINFDYNSHVICPYAGKGIPKEAFNSAMPSRYTSYIAGRKDVEIVINRAMTVQDPIQLNNNVTKGLSELTLNVFKATMMRSLELIPLFSVGSAAASSKQA